MMDLNPLESTEYSAKILKKVNWTHDAIIDLIIARPGISQIELAAEVGYTKQWVSRLLCSDAFHARMALRKETLIDPILTASAEERLRGTAKLAMDIIDEKLEILRDPKMALQALEITTKALSYGARSGGNQVNVQNNYVVAVPQKESSVSAWSASHDPTSAARRTDFSGTRTIDPGSVPPSTIHAIEASFSEVKE